VERGRNCAERNGSERAQVVSVAEWNPPASPGSPVRSFDTEKQIVYCIHKGYCLQVKPERSRKERIEEVDVFLSAH
jgi:hypothetical protein